MSPKQAAERIGISLDQVYRRIERGKLRVVARRGCGRGRGIVLDRRQIESLAIAAEDRRRRLDLAVGMVRSGSTVAAAAREAGLPYQHVYTAAAL